MMDGAGDLLSYIDCPLCGEPTIPNCERDEEGDPRWGEHQEQVLCTGCKAILSVRVDDNGDGQSYAYAHVDEEPPEEVESDE